MAMPAGVVTVKLTQETYLEWREFACAVQDAYDAWSRASRIGAANAADAFDEYMRVLDLEERVALEYAYLLRHMCS
jgi:hypothetical protein